MRRLVPLLFVSVPVAALAGPMVQGTWERGWEKPGLVVYDLHKDGACDNLDPWSAELAKKMGEDGTLAVRIDYMRDPESVKKLVGNGLLTVPLRIAYLDGKEVDRACGCMDTEALGAWMSDVAAGKTRADGTRTRLVGDLRKDVQVMLDLVQQDYCANRPEAGFTTLETMWTSLDRTDPELSGVRFGRVAHDMAVLARKSPEVSAKITAMRDALDATKDTDLDLLDDWVTFNRLLLQDDVTLAWFDAHRTDPAFSAGIAHEAPSLITLLVERDRWADAGNLIGDPEIWLEWAKPAAGGLELSVDSYAALHAAARGKEAESFAKSVLKVAPEGTACKLLARVTKAGAASSAQKKIAKACEDEAVVAAWTAAQ